MQPFCRNGERVLSKEFWKRKWIRLYSKIVREKAASTYIARGWAIGMFCGCFLPFGGQLIVSIPAAFLLKGSKIGATLGTLITNHFTIFIIYPVQCYAGLCLMGKARSFSEIQQLMQVVVKEQSFDVLMGLGMELVIAFFLGGAILAGVMTPLTYFLVKKMVDRYRSGKAVPAAAKK